MQVKDPHVRNQLEKRLVEQRSDLLWSYDRENMKSLSDELIISKFLLSSNKKDWNDLKKAFDKSSIKKVWEDDLLLGGFQLRRQEELVSFFFGSKNPSRYISDNKRKKLAQSFERSF